MLTNNRILDVLLRHQAAVEAVKNKKAKDFVATMQDLELEIRRLLADLGIEYMDSLTKSGLKKLIVEVKEIQGDIFNSYADQLLDDMLMFMESDLRLSKLIFASLKKERNEDNADIIEDQKEANDILLEDAEDSNLFAFSWLNERHDELRKHIWNAPIPANGFFLPDFVQNFSDSASNAIENLIRKAYANKLTVAATISAIVGTSEKNRRDSALTKIYFQNEAVIATSYQHITSIVQAGVASLIFGKYKWISVLDERTTDICIRRNAKIYSFVDGPFPPAHVRCRSKIIPWLANGGELIIPTFYTWIKAQPATVQDSILGIDFSNRLRNGSLKSSDLAQFDVIDEMDLDEFESSISDILTR